MFRQFSHLSDKVGPPILRKLGKAILYAPLVFTSTRLISTVTTAKIIYDTITFQYVIK